MNWLHETQVTADEWRTATLEGEVTVETQTAHTAVEAAEVLDEMVKGETYQAEQSGGPSEEFVKEVGDVVVAHLGTMTMLDIEAEEPSSYVEEDDPMMAAVRLLRITSTMAADAANGDHAAVEFHSDRVLRYVATVCKSADIRMRTAVEAAMEKNGARDWSTHQQEATK